ncbi:MAG: hypothetical protein WDN03_10000 [Rhizomicrobium sp.]
MMPTISTSQPEAEQRAGVLDQGRLDLRQRGVGIAAAQTPQQRQRLGGAVLQHQVARRLGHDQHEDDQQRRGDRGRGQHVAPAQIHQEIVVAHRLDEIVHEIDEVDADHDGDLLEGHKQPAGRGRRDLGDVHRRQHRGHADRGAAHQAVEDEEGQRRRAVHADEEFGKAGAQRRDEEQHARDQQAGAPAPARRDRAGDGRADHAAQQRAADGEAREEIRRRLRQVPRRDEIVGDRVGRPRDHRRVVAEQQPAQRGGNRQHDDERIVGLCDHGLPFPGLCARIS